MTSELHRLATLFAGFYLLVTFPLTQAALYVIDPLQHSSCRGGQPCTVTWLDDGRSPLLSEIGVSTVGLYTGTHKLVQTIPPVDVSTTLSLTFTPNPAAGPNSDAYFLAFISTEAKNGTEPYIAYSPWFRLDGMSGSFDQPLPSATSSIPIPSSLINQPTTTTPLSTVTIGSLYTTPTPDPTTSGPLLGSVPSSGTSTAPRSSNTGSSGAGVNRPLSGLSLGVAVALSVALGL